MKLPLKSWNYYLKNTNIRVIDYCYNLPIPKGSWIETARNYFVENGNTLIAELKNYEGIFVSDSIKFNLTDIISNINGKFKREVNNDELFIYEEVPVSGLLYYNDIVYLNSKYPGFNKEKIILEGNDFAKLFKEDNIFDKDEINNRFELSPLILNSFYKNTNENFSKFKTKDIHPTNTIKNFDI